MNWKEQLFQIESHFGHHEKREWKSTIEFVKNLVERYPYDVEVYIRTIYILHNILVEEDYSQNEYDEMTSLLKEHFNKSYSLFSENAEYLFWFKTTLEVNF